MEKMAIVGRRNSGAARSSCLSSSSFKHIQVKITENGAYKLTIENSEEDHVVGDDGAEILIECKNVYKSFGDKHILRGANFKVRG